MQGTAWLDDIFPRSSGNLPANSIGIDQIKAKAMKSGQKTLSPIFFFNFYCFVLCSDIPAEATGQPPGRRPLLLFFLTVEFNQIIINQWNSSILIWMNEADWLVGWKIIKRREALDDYFNIRLEHSGWEDPRRTMDFFCFHILFDLLLLLLLLFLFCEIFFFK